MGFSYAPTAAVRTGAERATLVRRTYALVFASVLVTMLGTAFGFSQPAVMSAVGRNQIITFIAMIAPLWMVTRAPREFPRNLILTFLFTFVTGVWLSPVIAGAEHYSPGVTQQAALLTFGAFGVLTVYALVSRRDFSAWGSFFIVGLFVLIAAGLINMFMQSAAVGLWLAGATVLVFSGLLVFDTWRLVRSGTYGPDDYVLAAVQIYMDLLNMFVAILRLLGGNRR